MEVDEALRLLGKYNKWQIRSFCVFGIAFGIVFGWMRLIVVFIGDTPTYRCNIPANTTPTEAIPPRDGNNGSELSTCKMYMYTTDSFNHTTFTNETTDCKLGYWFDPKSGYESTISTEWNLVCGFGWLVELTMLFSNVGSIIGAHFFIPLSDSIGRRPVFLFCLGLDVLVTFLQSFSPNLVFFTIMAALDGAFQTGLLATAAVMAVELFPVERRSFSGISIELFWAFAYISITGIAYFVRNWRHLQITITSLLSLTFVFYWLAPESIAWLVNNGRTKEAEDLIRQAVKGTDVRLPERIFKEPDTCAGRQVTCSKTTQSITGSCRCNDKTPKGSYTLRQILKSRQMKKIFFIMSLVWFTNGMSYYALAYSVTLLPGNRYVNNLFYGLQEFPAYLLAWLLAHKVGRRIPMCVSHLISASAMLAVAVVEFGVFPMVHAVVVTFSQIGKFFVTFNYALMYLYAPELYPTNFRTSGLAIHVICAKTAQLIAPFARTLNRSYPMIPPTCIGALCLLTGLLIPTLPETRHDALPETIEDVERLGQCRTDVKIRQKTSLDLNTNEASASPLMNKC